MRALSWPGWHEAPARPQGRAKRQRACPLRRYGAGTERTVTRRPTACASGLGSGRDRLMQPGQAPRPPFQAPARSSPTGRGGCCWGPVGNGCPRASAFISAEHGAGAGVSHRRPPGLSGSGTAGSGPTPPGPAPGPPLHPSPAQAGTERHPWPGRTPRERPPEPQGSLRQAGQRHMGSRDPGCRASQ